MTGGGGPIVAGVDRVEALCGSRPRYRSAGSARNHAERLTRDGAAPGWAVYPCPYAPPSAPHWHIDPETSLASLEQIARALRGLPDDVLDPHDSTPRTRRRRNRKEPRT